jgi:hypothetical protein
MLFFTLHIELQGPGGITTTRTIVLKNDTQASLATLERIFGHCVKVNLPVVQLQQQERIHAIRIEEYPFAFAAQEDLLFSKLAKKLQKIIKKRKEKAEMELVLKRIMIKYLETWNPN